jgi:hypothetical protein
MISNRATILQRNSPTVSSYSSSSRVCFSMCSWIRILQLLRVVISLGRRVWDSWRGLLVRERGDAYGGEKGRIEGVDPCS